MESAFATALWLDQNYYQAPNNLLRLNEKAVADEALMRDKVRMH